MGDFNVEINSGAQCEPLLNSAEAASLLQIHPKTLQRMARNGEVPARRIGDLWRFRGSELDAWWNAGVSSKGHSCLNEGKPN